MLMSEKLDAEIKGYEASMNDNGVGTEVDGTGVKVEAGSVVGHDAAQQQEPSLNMEVKHNPEPVKADPHKENASPKAGEWELRFKSYKTATDATIYKLRQDNAALLQSGTDLQTRMADLEAKQVLAAHEQGNTERMEKLLSPEVTTIVGNDVAKIMADTIADTVSSEVDPIKKDLAEARAKLLGQQQKDAADAKNKNWSDFTSSFKNLIHQNGFNYDHVNTDPGFVNGYLKGYDSVTGEKRGNILKSALTNYDAGAIAKLFVSYGRKMQIEKQSNIEPMGDGVNAKNQFRMEEPKGPESVTIKEIDDFYEEGHKSMKLADIDAFEAKVARCAKTGRIMQG